MTTVYLDHNATSPLLEEVQAAMAPWLGVPANPASAHRFGQRAAVAVEQARDQVAALVGGAAAGVVFTSGATEANHLFLRGIPRVQVAAVSALEHPSVHDAMDRLVRRGVHRVVLGTGADGLARLEDLPPQVDLISLMAANHETGILQPVAEVLERAEAIGARVHVDATQAAGRIPLALGEVDGVVLSSHKLGGPSGVGALVLPDGNPFAALVGGGAQERGRRAGTVNTAGVVGFGAACALARQEMDQRNTRWRRQRDRLEAAAQALGAQIIGRQTPRVANTLCVVFPDQEGETLVQALDLQGVAASHGAACASGSLEPSPVLTAMGVSHVRGALRLSLGPRTTDEEIERAIQALAACLTPSP